MAMMVSTRTHPMTKDRIEELRFWTGLLPEAAAKAAAEMLDEIEHLGAVVSAYRIMFSSGFSQCEVPDSYHDRHCQRPAGHSGMHAGFGSNHSWAKWRTDEEIKQIQEEGRK